MSLFDVLRVAAAAFVLVAVAPLAGRSAGRMSLAEAGALFLIADLAASLLVGERPSVSAFLLSAAAALFLYVARGAREGSHGLSGSARSRK